MGSDSWNVWNPSLRGQIRGTSVIDQHTAYGPYRTSWLRRAVPDNAINTLPKPTKIPPLPKSARYPWKAKMPPMLIRVLIIWALFAIMESEAVSNMTQCREEHWKAIHSAEEESRSSAYCDFQRKDLGGDKDVFLCHSGKQKNFVRQLFRDLTREHVSCFFDEDDKSLPLAEKFPPLIFKAAERCKIAVVFLSKEFMLSKWPMLELSAFISAKDSGRNANLIMLPIFFMINPKDLKNFTKDSPEWQKLEEKNDTRGEWQYALEKVRVIKGLRLGEDENEVDFRDKVVKEIRCLLQREAPQHQSQSEDDFEDFSDVDELYNSLPLDKVEGLEDLFPNVPPIILKEKVKDDFAAPVTHAYVKSARWP